MNLSVAGAVHVWLQMWCLRTRLQILFSFRTLILLARRQRGKQATTLVWPKSQQKQSVSHATQSHCQVHGPRTFWAQFLQTSKFSVQKHFQVLACIKLHKRDRILDVLLLKTNIRFHFCHKILSVRVIHAMTLSHSNYCAALAVPLHHNRPTKAFAETKEYTASGQIVNSFVCLMYIPSFLLTSPRQPCLVIFWDFSLRPSCFACRKEKKWTRSTLHNHTSRGNRSKWVGSEEHVLRNTSSRSTQRASKLPTKPNTWFEPNREQKWGKGCQQNTRHFNCLVLVRPRFVTTFQTFLHTIEWLPPKWHQNGQHFSCNRIHHEQRAFYQKSCEYVSACLTLK